MPNKGLLNLLREGINNLTVRAAAERFEAQLDQLIHSTQEAIRQEEEAINAAHASELVARARIDDLSPKIEELEDKAMTAIRGRRVSRAKELSATIAELTAQLRGHESTLELAAQQIADRKTLIQSYEGQIKRFRHQLGLRRAADNLQRSQEAIHRFAETGESCTKAKDANVSTAPTAEEIFQRLTRQAHAKPGSRLSSKKKVVKKTVKKATKTKNAKTKD